MGMVDNGLFQEFVRIHSDNVLPSQNFGWLAGLGGIADVPIGTVFRPRITISRAARSSVLNGTFRIQFERNLNGSWIFITNISDFCMLMPTIRFADNDHSLDLLLTTSGTINDLINGGYQSFGNGTTSDIYVFPAGISGIKFEPEWSCVFHGSTVADDSFRFRAVRSNGVVFAEGYDQYGFADAKAVVVDRVPKFKSEISQSVNMISQIQSAVGMKSDITAAVCMESNILGAVRMKTEISQAVNMRTEVC